MSKSAPICISHGHTLVKDIDHQPPGTRTVVVRYSLGANSSVFVANKAKYVDLIVALQPSMFSWNPSVTGNVRAGLKNLNKGISGVSA